MSSIEDLIQYHQECEFLDFKQEEYKSIKKHELIKDVLAFANADHEGDKFIIIGIKKVQNIVTVFEIENADDAGIIQQIITDNIKPHLNVSYTDYPYLGKNILILTIHNPSNKPYATKKVVNLPSGKLFLKEDAMKIRVGSINIDMRLEDLKRIMSTENSKNKFINKISLTFKETKTSTITLNTNAGIILPSQREIVKRQKEIREIEDSLITPKYQSTSTIHFNQNTRLMKNNKIIEINNAISRIPSIYANQDHNYKVEGTSHKLQLIIFNDADESLKNATLIIKASIDEGLYLSPRRLEIREGSFQIMDDNFTIVKDNQILNYKIEKIKHKFPDQEVFQDPLRLYFEPHLKGKIVILNCSLYADNLSEPIDMPLIINVI